ncbi:MAG: hypothetical protein P8X74_20445 [Reinekea sp.]
MACALRRYGVTDSGCTKKVHREAQLEGNGPTLVKSWNEAVDFCRASRRVGRQYLDRNFKPAGHINRRFI